MIKMIELTEGQRGCMEGYKNRAREMLDSVERIEDWLERNMAITGALVPLGKYYFFADKLGLGLDEEYIALVDRQLDLNRRLVTK